MNNPKDAKNFKYLYGPVSSWRLGSSLGVDLLSGNDKACTFNCVYCQLGGTPEMTKERRVYAPTKEVMEEIEALPADLTVDYITFSGNGEPTLAENLGEIIRKIHAIRPEKTAVITDSSLMWDKAVRRALSAADFVMAKLDASSEESFEKINRPARGLRFEDVYRGIRAFKEEYKGKLAIQIMFFDMNKDEYKKLAELVFAAGPDEIQINTPLRPCGVTPLPKEDIERIKGYFAECGRRGGAKAEIVSVYDAGRKDVSAIDMEKTLKRRGRRSNFPSP